MRADPVAVVINSNLKYEIKGKSLIWFSAQVLPCLYFVVFDFRFSGNALSKYWHFCPSWYWGRIHFKKSSPEVSTWIINHLWMCPIPLQCIDTDWYCPTKVQCPILLSDLICAIKWISGNAFSNIGPFAINAPDLILALILQYCNIEILRDRVE